MRALLGLLILGSLFVMAASWQLRTTSDLRDSQSKRYNVASDTELGGPGWSRLVLGRPSGADPLAIPEPARDPGRPPAPGTDGILDDLPPPVPAPPPVRLPPDRVYTVKKNEVLGTICQKEYEVRPLHDLIQRVARYNNLASAGDIREGQELLLPDARVLYPDRR